MLIAKAMNPDGGLLFGASHGYESVINEMMQRGASPEDILEDGANALIVACYHGGAPVQRLLLEDLAGSTARHKELSLGC